MKTVYFIFFIFSIESFAQSNRFLSINVQHIATTKRIKYFEQEKIIFRIKQGNQKYKGTITMLNDTSLTLDSTMTFLYKNISKVLVDNSNSLTHVATGFLSGCGIGYVTLDAFNNAINNHKPILRWIDVEIGIGLVAVGQAIKIISIKHYKINRKHSLQFIDDTP